MPISVVEPKKFLKTRFLPGIIVASSYRINSLITRNKTLTIMAIPLITKITVQTITNRPRMLHLYHLMLESKDRLTGIERTNNE